MFKALLATTALTLGLAASAHAVPALGLANGNQLFNFDTSTPGVNTGLRTITGLGNDTLLGFDVRPSNQVLYGFGASGSIYTVNPLTGAAVFVATLTNMAGGGAIATSGDYDVGFNPVADRLRVIGASTGQNLRVNVDNGVTAVDTAIASTATIVGLAYTNSNIGNPGATQLFDLNSAGTTLALQDPPNAGGLVVRGTYTPGTLISFDIEGVTNTAFVASATALYTISLANGATSLIGSFGTANVTDFTILPVPEPMSLALLGMGLAGVAAVRRRA